MQSITNDQDHSDFLDFLLNWSNCIQQESMRASFGGNVEAVTAEAAIVTARAAVSIAISQRQQLDELRKQTELLQQR